ncbi:hypothetical protein HHI36_017383, partial [Cryptolaemus montrouzieri]
FQGLQHADCKTSSSNLWPTNYAVCWSGLVAHLQKHEFALEVVQPWSTRLLLVGLAQDMMIDSPFSDSPPSQIAEREATSSSPTNLYGESSGRISETFLVERQPSSRLSL